MYEKLRTGIVLAIACALTVVAGQALSVAIECDPDFPDFERLMTLDPTTGSASCDTGGTGSVPQAHTLGDGWNKLAEVTSDGTDAGLTVVGIGDTEGTVTVDTGSHAFDQFFLVFNFGANIDPHWFRYEIFPVGNLFAANWGVEPPQDLSGVFLYGKGPTQVPVPGTLGLLGFSLAVLGLRYRPGRRRKV
jgi:hypothetical protein